MKRTLFIVAFLSILFISNANIDSIGIIKIDGSIFIKHQVDKSEGLYAISRKYGVSVPELKKANGDTLESLILDQVIHVPYMNRVVLKEEKMHKVVKGQTLYQVSKLYTVTVDDIKKWNKLESDNIREGQELIIILHKEKLLPAREAAVSPVAQTDRQVMPDEDIETVAADGDGENVKEEPDDDIIREEGIATFVDDQSFDSRSSLALHKSAPVGTIIKVTNLINNKEVFVKVVGNLPQENTKEIIKLNKYAARKLRIRDKITRVKLEYHQ